MAPSIQHVTSVIVQKVIRFAKEQALENELGLQRETLEQFVEDQTEAALIECLLRIGPAARMHFKHHPVLIELSNLPGIHWVELERLVRYLRNYTSLEALCAKNLATTEKSVRDWLTGTIDKDATLYWQLDGRLLTVFEVRHLAKRLMADENIRAV